MPILSLMPIWAWVLFASILGNIATVGLYRHEANQLASERTSAAAYHAQVEAEGHIAKEHAERTLKAQKQITEETTDGWSKALDVVRADYGRRMRNANPGGGAMPGISKPPESIDDTPADALPLAAICAETTLTLESLQRWILKQKDAGK